MNILLFIIILLFVIKCRQHECGNVTYLNRALTNYTYNIKETVETLKYIIILD